MHIVILDGQTVNSGDLSWGAFEQIGSLEVYPRTPADQIVERAQHADAVLINKAPITRQSLEQLPRLKYIGVLATGYNTIDTQAARERNIPVCNAAGYASESVAQHVFALLLELCNHVALHDQSIRSGEWIASQEWTYRKKPMVELAGKTLGIIGLGKIGQTTARLARGFGMKVIAHNRSPRQIEGIEMTGLNSLFSRSDVISLHCPLTEENRGFVNEERISSMKASSYLINTGRGPLINEKALADALNQGKIAGAGLDVLSVESPEENNPLFKAKNCVLTPHNAWGTRECRERLIHIAADNLASFVSGHPKNVVNDIF